MKDQERANDKHPDIIIVEMMGLNPWLKMPAGQENVLQWWNKFLLRAILLARKRDECQVGLKPTPHAVQVSALTFRPPALYALSLL